MIWSSAQLGVAFVVLGALSIFLPLIASLVTTIVLGWLMVLAGSSQGFHAFANRRWALGLLVGIDLVFSGSSRLLIGLGARPVVRVTP